MSVSELLALWPLTRTGLAAHGPSLAVTVAVASCCIDSKGFTSVAYFHISKLFGVFPIKCGRACNKSVRKPAQDLTIDIAWFLLEDQSR